MSVKMLFGAMQAKVGSPTTKLVLLKLADNANDTGECWPSYASIAEVCEISKRSAMNHIEKLVEAGFIRKQKRKGEKGNASNIYVITINERGEKSALPPSENNSLPSENNSLPPSEKSAPGISQISEPVKEPSVKSDSDESNKTASQVPYSKIHELYQTILVNTGENEDRLTSVVELTTKRKARIKSFWMKMGRDIGKVERYFRWLWEHKANHTWLFGANNRGWVADIEYICREETVVKARENKLSNWGDAA